MDGETFLSVDDLRINIWNINNTKEVYSVLDTRPSNINDIEEAITSAEFHPFRSSLFNYTTSKGVLHLCDFRERSNFQHGSTIKLEGGHGLKKNALTEIVTCVSKAKFLSQTDHILVSRDYLTVKFWDVRGTQSKPFRMLAVCDYLEKGLVSLYEDDSIYDRFFLDLSPNY